MPVVHPKRPSLLTHTPVAGAVLLALGSPSAHAQQQDAAALGEVYVTAQKRSENLQDVPISLESISNESIEQLNIQSFKTYTQYLPTAMGSEVWAGFTPGNDARAVFNARRAGGAVLGKTVTAEFGVHEPGRTRNPHDLTKSTGTSSSGSAMRPAWSARRTRWSASPPRR